MTLKILFIGDPVAELKPGRETTLALIFEAQLRDMNVDYCTAKDLCLTNGKVIGRVQSITLKDNLNDHIHTATARMQNLTAYDIIVLRSNPAGYARIDTSYVLDILADKVLIVNDPRGIREMHGKYFISQLPDFIVPYAFVEHPEHLKTFMDEHKDVIIKPVNGFGGYGIRRIKEKPADINALFDEIYTEYGNSPFIVQPFIADAVKGDKRIIMFDGLPVCAMLRVPADEDSLANVTQGARTQKCEMTPREQVLCEELGPVLRDYGLFFTGIDMLGDYLTEINLISVGTIVPANELYGIRLEETFWDMLLKKHEQFHQPSE